MRHLPLSFLLLAGGAAVVGLADDRPNSNSPVAVVSPDGRVRIEVFVDPPSGARYRVFFRQRPVVLDSRIATDLADGTKLGADSTIERVERRDFRETYRQFPGKRSAVLNHGAEAAIGFRERAGPRLRWELIARAYDDGVAFRFRFPEQKRWERLEIAAESTEYQLPGDPTTFAMPLPSFTTAHEEHFRKLSLSQLTTGQLIGLPLLAELPGVGWMAILEADLTDYAALYLARAGEKTSLLTARLAPRQDEAKVAVRAALPHESPWRVIMVADRPERLIESDIALNLNKPNAIGDTSWIRPGKTTFPWWNGFYEESVPFKMGLNTETAKFYIDFCAEAGIPYHSLDGLDNVAWYGGPIVPYQGADIVQGGGGLDLQEVIRHAKSKGVKLRLWMNWKAADKHLDRAFPLYRQWGIEGVMVDFLDRDDQPMSRFIHRLLKTAAENHLTITIHNTKEPTGLERTYPNLLTTEGVRNLEYNKWDSVAISPEEDLMAPFTRMLAGPLDYHQGSLRGVPAGQYHPRNAAPLVIGTPCHMLGSYVVYQNHLPMVADYPSAYRRHSAASVLAQIPVTWNDTRCLAGRPGEYIVVARRDGTDWWIGAMAGGQPRELDLPLDFLDKGVYRATIHGDDVKSPSGVSRLLREVGAGDRLRLSLAPAGGALARLSPTR